MHEDPVVEDDEETPDKGEEQDEETDEETDEEGDESEHGEGEDK